MREIDLMWDNEGAFASLAIMSRDADVDRDTIFLSPTFLDDDGRVSSLQSRFIERRHAEIANGFVDPPAVVNSADKPAAHRCCIRDGQERIE